MVVWDAWTKNSRVNSPIARPQSGVEGVYLDIYQQPNLFLSTIGFFFFVLERRTTYPYIMILASPGPPGFGKLGST
jgi:hypothetical protein